MSIEKMPPITGMNNNTVHGQARSQGLVAGQKKSTTAPRVDNPSDSVDISHSLSRVAHLDHDDIDSAKVQRLRQSIAEGRYQTDSGKIADALIALRKGGV
ncbi:flagellar biosynthesis anti-sigma factor FlgM [Rosenbergiella gaditana]|nr:flagellar biosynthesis anti-sigma factor FlgM [Rosenbergiella gaditana]